MASRILNLDFTWSDLHVPAALSPADGALPDPVFSVRTLWRKTKSFGGAED
jgi:hypothetical protein